MLLPREHLPLSSLDLSRPNGDFLSSRFYESNIRILELEGRLGSNVLLARSETKRIVYAIERESSGLYVLCKLGAWVDVEKLASYATVVSTKRLKSCAAGSAESMEPGSHAVITTHMHHENKKRRLAIEDIQSVVNKRARSQSIARPEKSDPTQIPTPVNTDSITPALNEGEDGLNDGPGDQPGGHQQIPSQLSANPLPEEPIAQPTAEDICQNIRLQYLEALYHSRGSLAYFAKGPLSRARAAFHLDCDSNLDMDVLIDFLKGLVTTTVIIDKKYRETIPEIIGKLKIHVEDSEQEEHTRRKRKTKKTKLGKDGLYPSEIEHIKKWWATCQPAQSENDEQGMTVQEQRYHISCIRRRETQLQMILIFEILALEPLGRPTENVESQLPGTESQDAPLEPSSDVVPKKRSKHNFPTLLDVHADRLCIWQSTTLDEVKALAESQLSLQMQQANKSEGHSDSLSNFCVDVILPLYVPGPRTRLVSC
jgi:DNA replication regulator SLD3